MTSSQEKQVIKELNTMRQLIYSDQCMKTIRQIMGQDIVIFLGNTRSGKSTLVNYVIGNQLTAVKSKHKYHIVTADASKGPIIGAGSTSETTIPTAWTSTKIDGVIVDAPGFDDNRGESQDVANAFYIKELLTNAKSAKFVLISDIHNITDDNVNNFISFTDNIFTMLPQCGALQSGMAVVFNKDTKDYTREEICEDLTSKVLQQPLLKAENRCLVEYLVKNPNHIIITKAPKALGELEDTVFDGFIDVIQNHTSSLSKELLATVTPTISQRSKSFLLTAHSYFTESKDLDKALAATEAGFDKKMKEENFNLDVTSKDELRKVEEKLLAAGVRISALREAQLPVPDTLRALSLVLPEVDILKPDSDLYMKLGFISFVDQFLNIKNNQFLNSKVDFALSSMKDKTNHLRIEAQQKLSKISEEEANRQFNELREEMHRREIAHLTEINRLQAAQMDELKRLKNDTGSCALL